MIKFKYLNCILNLHLYLITVLTKVIAIVFVFENFIVFVIVFKYYAMYLDPSLIDSTRPTPLSMNELTTEY